ncbi:hypothetical protein FQR65_LT17093 [Abscondita terminalis]|nr:hypothetical protein FQR65_LT17093 [Abscondita terminalis]
MSRYTGSTFKKARLYGFSILETGKEFSKGKKRTTAPGQHGARRTKLSGYGQQMQEKQKVKFMYGLTERQFRNTYARAKKIAGITGTNFLQLLESRLDNVTYRMGMSLTRQGARQLVSHGHILVNGSKVDIPSYTVKSGDVISLKAKLHKNDKVVEALASAMATVEFVKFDKTKFSGSKVEEVAIAEFINLVFDEMESDFIPIASVVEKAKLNEDFTISESLAYNFFVLNLIKFYVKLYGMANSPKAFNILMDERNLKKTQVNDLENILKTTFIEKPITVSTYYLSSKTADIIRFADVLDHIVFHHFNNPEGYKNLYYKETIKPRYWQRIMDGLIYYPFEKSFFKKYEEDKKKK